MPKQRSTVALLLPPLTASANAPLHRQIFDALRTAMLDGRLGAGMRLPASRELARELGLSRTTVLTAYDQLTAEGFVVGRSGSGTFVSETMPGDLIRARAKAPPAEAPAILSDRGSVLAGASPHPTLAGGGALRPFRAGYPAIDAFPTDLWARLVARRWRRGASDLLGYGDPAGYLPLRVAIAEYLRLSRGVRCTEAQVIIVAGSQQGFDLVARLLLDPGDTAWVEQPGFAGVEGALRGAGVRTVPVPVDAEGLDVAAGARLAPRARLVSVTPSHQYPAGVTMTLARRLSLLEWASQSGAWVLEDDYDAEFRYSGRALKALQGLDSEGRVIYLGTFSKVLAPALRLGYLVVPPTLVDAFTRAVEVVARHAPAIEQAVLADFITEGHFARHLRRMQTMYAERQGILLEAARESAGTLLELRPAEAGLHVVGWLPAGRNAAHVAGLARSRGVDVYPFTMQVKATSGLMLGYAPFAPAAIRASMAILAGVLAEDAR